MFIKLTTPDINNALGALEEIEASRPLSDSERRTFDKLEQIQLMQEQKAERLANASK